MEKESILQLMPYIDIAYKSILILINIIFVWFSLSKRSNIRSLLNQILLILFLVSLFLNIALIFNFNSVDILSYGMVISFNISLFTLLYMWIKEKHYKRYSLKNTFPFLIILVIYTLIELFFVFNSYPRWDGNVYYYKILTAVKNFDFSLTSYFYYFKVGHTYYAYFSFLSIGQFINYGNLYLLNIQNYILSVVSIYSFYKVIQYYFLNIRYLELLLVTLLFAFSPLFFAVSLFPSADTALIIFLPICFYCYLYDKKLLFIFTSIVFCISKEPGFLIYCFLVLAIFLDNFVIVTKDRNSVFVLINNVIKRIYLFIPIFFFIITKIGISFIGKLQGHTNVNSWAFTMNNNGLHCWGINSMVIKNRLFEMFLINFQWIFLLFIVLFILREIITPFISVKNRFSFSHNFLVLIIPFVAFVLFNILYITYVHPRYVVSIVFFNVIFFYYAISNLIKNSKPRVYIILFILLLNILSIVRTFDPVTLHLFKEGQFKFGKHKMVAMGDNTGACRDDRMIYNGQFIFIDMLFNKFIEKFDISNSDTLLFSNHRWEMGFDNYLYSPMEDKRNIYVNSISKKRTYTPTDAFIPIVYYDILIDTSILDSLPNKGYYLVFMGSPMDSLNLVKIKQIYTIKSEESIKTHGYSLNVFRVEKKGLL